MEITVTKIADYFNVSVDYLLGNEQKETPDIPEDARRVMDEIEDIIMKLHPDQRQHALDILRTFHNT